MHDDVTRRALDAIAKQDERHRRIEVAPGVWTPRLQDSQTVLGQVGVPDDLSGMRVLDIVAHDEAASWDIRMWTVETSTSMHN